MTAEPLAAVVVNVDHVVVEVDVALRPAAAAVCAYRQITQPLAVVANHRGLPNISMQLWAAAPLG